MKAVRTPSALRTGATCCEAARPRQLETGESEVLWIGLECMGGMRLG